MNDPQLIAPTLLSLTAPERREPLPDAQEPGFAEELETASHQSVATSNEPEALAERESSELDQPAAKKAADQPTEGTAPVEATEDDAIATDDLLVVSLAVETLVLETPPDVQLPKEASTIVDISLENPIEVVSAELVESTLADGVTTASNAEVETPLGLDEILTGEQSSAAAAVPANDDEQALELRQPGNTVREEARATTLSSDALIPEESIEEVATAPPDLPRFQIDSPEQQPAEPPTQSGNAVNFSDVSSEAGDEQNSEASHEQAQPIELPPDGATGKPTETSNASVESTNERAPLPSIGSGNESRSSSLTSINRPAADPVASVDPTRFVSRVARAFDLAQERGGGPIEIRLSPPELGSMQVKIEVKEGVMTASLDVETPAARNALLDNLPALRDRLEQQQIRIEKFDVDVRDDSGQRGGDWQPSGGSSDERSNDRREPTPDGLPTPEEAATQLDSPAASTIDFGDDAINLVA